VTGHHRHTSPRGTTTLHGDPRDLRGVEVMPGGGGCCSPPVTDQGALGGQVGKKNRNLVDSLHKPLPNRQWISGWQLLGGSANTARRCPVGSGVRSHVRLIDSDTCQEGPVAQSPGARWPAVVPDHIRGRSPSPPELPGFEDPNRRSRASCVPTGVAHRDSRPRDSDRTNGSLRLTNSLAITLARTTTCVLHHPLSGRSRQKIRDFSSPLWGVWRSLNLLAGYRPYRTPVRSFNSSRPGGNGHPAPHG
jgi:hypothetical protein